MTKSAAKIEDTTTAWALKTLHNAVAEYKDAFPDSTHALKFELALDHVERRTMRDIPEGYVLRDLHNSFAEGGWFCKIEQKSPYGVFFANNHGKGYISPGEALEKCILMIKEDNEK